MFASVLGVTNAKKKKMIYQPRNIFNKWWREVKRENDCVRGRDKKKGTAHAMP
jgi:hypothetical protein